MKDETKFWLIITTILVLGISGTLLYQQHQKSVQYQESDYRPVNVTVLDKFNVTKTWVSEDDTFGGDYMAVKVLNREDNSVKYYITGQNQWDVFPVGLNCTISQGNLEDELI